MGAASTRSYKRSWKNYLLDARYQLRFTAFMVGLSALLMGLLGFWVMQTAAKSTAVAVNNVLGVDCPKPARLGADETEPDVTLDAPPQEPVADKPAADKPAADKPAADKPAADKPAADKPAADDGPVRQRPTVHLDESEIEAVLPAAEILSYHMCRAEQLSTIDRLRAGQTHILYVLVAAGILLCCGLGLYSIKMTHKVAGPLYKVGLYLDKMRDGKFDEVYNLRKGDQLMEFYHHFKEAHGGLTRLQRDDLRAYRDFIAALDALAAGDAGAIPPDVQADLDELRAAVKSKEESGA